MNLEEIKGLTILGGEPFQNTEDLIEIVGKIREKAINLFGYIQVTLTNKYKLTH